jgi:reactive intermediate/imine deaminase
VTTQPTPITLANDPLAPYLIAPGWRVGDLLFLSGQASIGADGSIVGAGDIDAQIAQTFANIEAVLAAGGSDLSKVVKVTIYLTDMSHFPKILEARARWFSSPYPADTTVEVKGLALPELMVEIDVIAAV